jgi:hypothetical protein
VGAGVFPRPAWAGRTTIGPGKQAMSIPRRVFRNSITERAKPNKPAQEN